MVAIVKNEIAFLGLGVMGAPMSVNFAHHNLSIKAWNRTIDRPGLESVRESGATIVNSIQEAVESASIIFTCLGDIPDVEEVIFGDDGIVNHASPHSIIVDFSTIGSQGARAIALKLKSHNIRFYGCTRIRGRHRRKKMAPLPSWWEETNKTLRRLNPTSK